MKIIVTGGCGFIGSALVRYLLADKQGGYEVLNIDKLTYAGHQESIPNAAQSKQYQFKQLDICSFEEIRSVVRDFKPDAIMHLAAESHVDRSIDGPSAFLQTNVVGTYNMLQAATEYYRDLEDARKKSFRFLHVSTDEVYGALEDAGEFSEETPYRPTSPYSASKAASDHFVQAWHHTYGLPTLATNCGNNYGPFQYLEKLIPLAIMKGLRREPIPVYGTGKNVRDWIFVDDHVRALMLVLNKGKAGETYNIGTRGEQRNIDVIEQICLILDELRPQAGAHKDLISFVSDRPGHDFRYAINPNKIYNELGFRPKESFESGIRKTVRWYLDQQEQWCKAVLDRAAKSKASASPLSRRGTA